MTTSRPTDWMPPRAAVVGALWSVAVALVCAFTPLAHAEPYVWDDDEDGIDDRVETVNVLGYQFSFEAADTLLRQRVVVSRVGGGLLYGVYVVYDHSPTDQDILTLTGLGMPALHRYRNVAAVRSTATFAQVELAAALPGVQRVEAVPLLYPVDRAGAASIGVRDPSGHVAPTTEATGGGTGAGIVIAILDTGINDQPSGSWPGHEALSGRFLGGAAFVGADSTFDTPYDGSFNPSDHGASAAHGTHVAGIALGVGGASAIAPGVAPDARFVDVKVLGDAGYGTGVPEGIDWCIHNRNRAWSGDPAYHGIDVINLSLSSLDESDGNDVASKLAERAVELGIVVVASMGNGGDAGFVPSPAAGDGVIAVGAFDDQRTARAADDVVPSFSNTGPRVSDGDGDAIDELKPDVVAPGVSVLAADGDLSGSGNEYRRLSGTSMSAAYVSGVAALIQSTNVWLTPGQIRELLRVTARRTLPVAPDGSGADPRWHPVIGWGAVDAYAALLELAAAPRSQIRRFTLEPQDTQILATLWTMREIGALHFVFERAPDAGGVPGTFVAVDSVPAVGNPSLGDVVNLQSYARTWPVPAPEYGGSFWYRIAYSENGSRHTTVPQLVISPSGPRTATIEVTIVHNAYDTDVDAEVLAGPGAAGSFGLESAASPPIVIPVPSTSAAVSNDWVTGTSTTGNVAWEFSIPVPAGEADSYLPPSGSSPWLLSLQEGGFVNRRGRVTEYRIVWHSPQGDVVFEGGPVPQGTLEGQTIHVWAPQGAVGVEPIAAPSAVRIFPNPAIAGSIVRFSLPASARDPVSIFDLAGRRVARLSVQDGEVRWEGRDASGRALPAGLYFARAGDRPLGRIVLLND